MKILAVQLLRLGDVICLGPAISQLRKKYPSAQIDLLINDEAVKAAPLFSDIQNTFVFERSVIQSGLGEIERGLFESFDRLHEVVTDLSRQNYDLIINFTQNKLSARIVGLIKCSKKIGMVHEGGAWSFESPIFQALNQNSQDLTKQFHFSDIFRLAVDVDSELVMPQLRETKNGKEEARRLMGKDKTIAFQPFTSDVKKNWPAHKFVELYRMLSVFYPKFDFVLLGAPDEKKKIEKEFSAILKNQNCRVEILSIEGVFSFLKNCQLLVTGDTSIKHLAAAAGVSIVEISLGSSDANATGPYTDRAVVLSAKIGCRPCIHSRSCYREKHYCSEPISSDLVAMASRSQLDKNDEVIRELASEFGEDVIVHRTRFTEDGFWSLSALADEEKFGQLDAIVSRIGHRQWLKHGGVGPDIGSDCYSYRSDFLNSDYIARSFEKTEQVRSQFELLHQEMGRLLVGSKDKTQLKYVRKLSKKMSLADSFHSPQYQSLLNEILAFGFSGDFLQVKQLRKKIEELLERCRVEKKVIKFFEQYNWEVNHEPRA